VSEDTFRCVRHRPKPLFSKDDTRFIDEDVIMEDSTSMTKKAPYDPDKNAHLKGRRRFTADLSDIQEACTGGLVVSGLVLKSTFSSSNVIHTDDVQNRDKAWRR